MRILLLGIGNLLFGDEGVGVHFINYIKQKYRLEGLHKVDVMDGGTLAQRLIPIMAEYDRLIIVDTINTAESKPGEVYFFDFDCIPESVDWQGSAHEVEMLQTLNMMELSGDRPKTMILGIVPTVIAITEFSLSQSVRQGIELMEKALMDHLKSLEVEAIIFDENVKIESVLATSFKMADV